MIINGFFESRWEEGTISTPATLDLDTGEIETTSVCVGEEYENLNEEVFISSGGEEYTVCPDCHYFITKTEVREDDVGNGLHDVQVCRGRCQEGDYV
jgi:hypothetical protein